LPNAFAVSAAENQSPYKTTFLVSSIILIFNWQLNLLAGNSDYNPTNKDVPIVKAMAVAPGFVDSQIAMAVYTIR